MAGVAFAIPLLSCIGNAIPHFSSYCHAIKQSFPDLEIAWL